MDEMVKSMFAQLPLVTVVGIALWRVYSDGKADRKYMMDLIEKQYIILVELAGGKISEHEEALSKRP